MKKIYLAVFLACSIGGAVRAQQSEGGLPWSQSLKDNLAVQQVSKLLLAEPDYDRLAKEDEEDGKKGGKIYRAAVLTPTDISLNSGTWTYLDNGKKVWRLQVETPGAKAVNFYWDKFNLPEGVKLYLTNGNGKQILGAYTSANNNKFNNFAVEEIQGNVAVLEMDIEASANVKDISFHINKSGAFYRGVNLIDRRYATDEETGAKPTNFGDASECHVNANCPEGDAYMKSKNATVRVVIPIGENGIGFCSGTLLNNTANAAGGACKPYILLASHCDDANGRNDEHFAQWLFTFNYMYVNCAGAPPATFVARTGAKFRARSKYPSFPALSDKSAVADFLLVEMSETPPVAQNPYLAGWNRNPNIYQDEDYNVYIGFHHPAGDAKKLSRSGSVQNDGTFNQTFEANTHWRTNFTVGGSEGGSSGSGLFDKDGLLIGDLSGGPDGIGSCAPMNSLALYSKLSYAWDNTFDQSGEFAGAQSRLRDWLDPVNSGMTSLPATKFDCTDMPTVGVNELQKQLEGSVNVFPNPASSGVIKASLNLADISDLNVSFYNVVGAKQGDFQLNGVKSGTYTFDLKNCANGVYLMKITTKDNVSITKRVVISR
jgi:lysyl endopeptidase